MVADLSHMMVVSPQVVHENEHEHELGVAHAVEIPYEVGADVVDVSSAEFHAHNNVIERPVVGPDVNASPEIRWPKPYHLE